MKEITHPRSSFFFVSYKRIHNIVMTETRELRKEDNVFRNMFTKCTMSSTIG